MWCCLSVLCCALAARARARVRVCMARMRVRACVRREGDTLEPTGRAVCLPYLLLLTYLLIQPRDLTERSGWMPTYASIQVFAARGATVRACSLGIIPPPALKPQSSTRESIAPYQKTFFSPRVAVTVVCDDVSVSEQQHVRCIGLSTFLRKNSIFPFAIFLIEIAFFARNFAKSAREICCSARLRRGPHDRLPRGNGPEHTEARWSERPRVHW